MLEIIFDIACEVFFWTCDWHHWWFWLILLIIVAAVIIVCCL